MRGRRFARPGVLVAVAATLLTAGCGLIPHSKLYDPPKASPGARYGGVLRVGIGQPQGIEPAAAYEPNGRMISSLICEPLVTIDPQTGVVKPALAQSWHTADDGKSLFITLARNLKFANGDKLNSGSIYDALNLLASPDYQSYVASLLSNVAGYDSYHDKGKNSGGGVTGGASPHLAQVRVIDTWSVQIQLTDKDPSFLRTLADPATAPIDGAVQQHDPAAFARDPVCLGPYRLARPWDPDQTVIKLVRNPAYHPDDTAYTNRGKGYPDEIDFHVYPDAAAELAAYDAGEIDVATGPGTDVQALRAKYGAAVATGPGTVIDLLAFPTTNQPFDNAALRRALSLAIDRKAIATGVYDGGRTAMTGFVPPVVGEDAAKDSSCANAPAGGDVAAARTELANAAVDLAGKKINVYYDDEFDHKQVVAAIASQWHAAFGVTVVPHPMQWDDYIKAATNGASFDGPFLESWDQLPHRQVDYLLPLFTREGLGTGNLSRYDGREAFNIVQSGLPAISNTADQVLELHKLGAAGCADMPVTPLTLHSAVLVARPSVVGSARATVLLALDGAPVLREFYLRQPGGTS